MVIVRAMTSQSHQPMLWAALAYGAGIWGGAHCWRPATWWATAAAVLLIAAAYWVRPRNWAAAGAVLAATAALGAIAVQLHNPARERVDLGAFANGHPVTVTAHVTRDGVLRPGAYGGQQQSIEVESEEIADPEAPEAGPRRISVGMRLAIYSREEEDAAAAPSTLPVLRYGQRIRLMAKLREPRNYGNPGAWDQKSYLARQGIFAFGSAKAEEVEILPGFGGTRFEALRTAIRRSVLEHFRSLWNRADAPLICAMLIGEQTLVDRDTRVTFQRTGAYHILVVSGMNVGILAFVVFWTLRRLRQGEVLSTLVTVTVTGLYTCLTDLGAPILRATFRTAFALALMVVRRRRIFVASGLAALVASAFWLAAVPPGPKTNPGKLEITALDVGQGDSLLVVTPAGKTVLVDSGGTTGVPASAFDVGEDVVSPYLWSRGIRRLDAAVVTHAHSDHMGGMRSVIANFHPRELWVADLEFGRDMEELSVIAEREGVQLRRYSAPSRFGFGGTEVEVLSPPANWQPGRTAHNNDSLVMKFSYGGRAALLVGDAEKRVERRLATAEVRADLLKVGHHGSANATTREFLDAVRPSFAIITAGYRNRFRYPRPEVLSRLDAARVRSYRTDLDGAVTFFLDESGVSATLPNRQ